MMIKTAAVRMSSLCRDYCGATWFWEDGTPNGNINCGVCVFPVSYEYVRALYCKVESPHYVSCVRYLAVRDTNTAFLHTIVT